jgi:hypothetical protein
VTVFQNLKSYYQEAGISAKNFRCRYLADCKRDCANFTEAREAFVGTEYEKGLIPRLLFLSLDSGDGDEDPELRTMEWQRHWEENLCNVDELPRNLHWYRTHELAYYLLRRFDPNVKLSTINAYFSHTNSAKCCMNNDARKMADWRMFNNCKQYIPEELSCLKPDILVTQGDRAKDAIDENFDCSPFGNQKHCGYALIKIGGRDVFWIHTYHPRYFGGFNRQRRDCYDDWSDLVVKFMNRTTST